MSGERNEGFQENVATSCEIKGRYILGRQRRVGPSEQPINIITKPCPTFRYTAQH
jgi:hypothetical protein